MMEYKKIEDVELLRRFSKSFDKEYYLLKYEATTEGEKAELYYLLQVVGKIHIDENLAQSLATTARKEP